MVANKPKIFLGIALAAFMLSAQLVFAIGSLGEFEIRRFGIESLAPEVLPLGQASEGASAVEPLDSSSPPIPRTRRSTLNLVDVEKFVTRLESDRRLLSELRKEVPEARMEAELYLKRLKDLAARSDPVRLVPLVNRVLEQAPIYFNWVDRDFESEEERAMEYYVGGARGFNFALETFKSAVMMTVINRLDIAARVINELDPDSIQ